MKTFKRNIAGFFASLISLQLFAQGYIVPNGVVDNLFSGEIDLVWAAATQINGFGFEPVGKTSSGLAFTNIFRFGEPLTIGVRVFSITTNQMFTLDAIRAGVYSEISKSTDAASPSSPTNIISVNLPFYVALYSGANFAAYYPSGNTNAIEYTDPVFGWARLVNNQGVIQLLGGALAYGGAGIYVGTQNIIPVPEPGALALAALGGLGLALVRNHQRRRV